ncbi:MAG: hypothetical protein HF314_08015 [Ignavibacteria bacterium]|jgi:hypothetical protein|nr:hypothetical protein [Ignavibacteria bacterium]MCU7517013.1 hypothetical protein [Ignavibacteria bacterium]
MHAKVINLSDSTTVVIYPGPDQDKPTLDLFENGVVTVEILKDIVYSNNYDWHEFNVIQPKITRTYSDTCKAFLEDEKTVFIINSSSKVNADGSTIHTFSFLIGNVSQLSCFDLIQIKQDHFAIRCKGFVL